MRKVLFGICLIVYSLFGSTDVSARDVISFNGGWEFEKGLLAQKLCRLHRSGVGIGRKLKFHIPGMLKTCR